MRKAFNVYHRQELKSFEGEFLYELQHSYELSPRLSEQILQTAKMSLFQSEDHQPGQIEVVAAGLVEKSGKQLERVEKRRVTLTLDNGTEDLQSLQTFGRPGLRRIIIQRITEEAIEQGGILSQEDLGHCLHCSVRTIKRDIQAIRRLGLEVITRGVFHNVGRGQTHKSQIINLYLNGFTYTEIKRKTQHSISAIKRYLESFSKVLMSIHYGIKKSQEIALVTGLSAPLIMQYRQIIANVKKSPIMQQHLTILLEQSQYRSGLKKTISHDGLRAAVTGAK
jgi:biotin operon repressor